MSAHVHFLSFSYKYHDHIILQIFIILNWDTNIHYVKFKLIIIPCVYSILVCLIGRVGNTFLQGILTDPLFYCNTAHIFCGTEVSHSLPLRASILGSPNKRVLKDYMF